MRNAVTCSKDCSKLRTKYWMSRRDQAKCRYCLRPATPEERARYQAWRRWERKGMTEEQSAAKLLHENRRLKTRIEELEDKLIRAITRIEQMGGDGLGITC
jgi:hypothetical protein